MTMPLAATPHHPSPTPTPLSPGVSRPHHIHQLSKPLVSLRNESERAPGEELKGKVNRN